MCWEHLPSLAMPSSKPPRRALTTTSAASAMDMQAMVMREHERWPGVSSRLMRCSSPSKHHSLGVMLCSRARSSLVLSDIHAKRRIVCPAVLAAASTASKEASDTELVSCSVAPTTVDLPHCIGSYGKMVVIVRGREDTW